MKVELFEGKASIKCSLKHAVIVFKKISDFEVIREEYDSISFDAGYRLSVEEGDFGKITFKSLVDLEELELELRQRGYQPYLKTDSNYLHFDLGYKAEIIIRK